MKTNTLLTCILDAMDDICYVSDPETYELIYVNRAGRQYLPKGQEIIGRKCYHALQQLYKPCDFCTNHLLSPGLKYNYERFNAYVDDHFAITDTLIEVDGKLLRLEVARNITEYKNFQKNLEHRLNLEETLSACVRCLASGQNASDNINNLLAVIGEYYGANRAYIFEIYYDRKTLDNTYEWCRPGVSVQIDNLKNLPIEAIDVWLKRFRGQGYFSITALKDLSPDSLDYQILEPQGVESLMAAPLVHNEKIVGFLGVDDPTCHTDELRLLQTVPFFLQNEMVKRRMIEKMEWLSFRDALTGLYNRNKYASTLNELMENPPCKMGIIYVDINGLKIANDSHGHEYGDRMIARVAGHIELSVRGDAYRIGGDEFVVLCPAVEEQELEAMVGALRKRMAVEDISVSIGTSWNDGMVDVTDLIRFADHRMYAEKQNYYKSQLGGQKIRMEDAARELMAEIERGEFVVKFQPQVDLQTGCIAGAEAYVRKIGANSVMATPDKFVPIYEMEGVIRHLDFYLLERACAAVKDLAEVKAKIPIMTSFSPYTLQEPGVVNDMLHICQAGGVDASRICIRLPPGVGNMEPRFLQGLLEELHHRGFCVALGGVCSELSNLSILASVHFDRVIFEGGFISEIGSNPRAEAFLEHTMRLCRSLGSTCSLGYGIEHEAQAEFLKKIGCCRAQGRLFYRPFELEHFKKLCMKEKVLANCCRGA